MSEIPEDIMAEADKIREALNFVVGWAPVEQRKLIARALMEAEARGLEEAERIARLYENTWRPAAGFGDRAVGAKVVADTIRGTILIRAEGKPT